MILTNSEILFLNKAKEMASPFSVRDKAFSNLFGGGLMGMSDAICAYQGLTKKGILIIVDRDFDGDPTKAIIKG